jgi:hypothetical protein
MLKKKPCDVIVPQLGRGPISCTGDVRGCCLCRLDPQVGLACEEDATLDHPLPISCSTVVTVIL